MYVKLITNLYLLYLLYLLTYLLTHSLTYSLTSDPNDAEEIWFMLNPLTLTMDDPQSFSSVTKLSSDIRKASNMHNMHNKIKFSYVWKVVATDSFPSVFIRGVLWNSEGNMAMELVISQCKNTHRSIEGRHTHCCFKNHADAKSNLNWETIEQATAHLWPESLVLPLWFVGAGR